MNRISGPALIGFGDFFEDDLDAVGATKAAKKPAQKKPTTAKTTKTAASKKKPVINVPRNQTVRQHGKVMTSARVTAARAVKAASAALKTAKKPPPRPVPVTAVGAANLTPKQKQAVSKSNAATQKAAKIAVAAAVTGKKTKTAAIELAKRIKNQKAASAALRKPKSTTRVRGIDLIGNTEIGAEVAAMFDEYYDMVGASPDPNNPGYLDDGTEDPAFLEAAAATDPALETGEVPMDTDADLPPPPSMDTFIPDASLVGGLVYNDEKGTPDGYCGSFGLMMRTTDISANPDSPGIDGTAHYGYVWGKFDREDPSAGVAYGNQFPENRWVHVHGKGSWGAGWRGKDNHNYAARYDKDGYNATTLDDALTSPRKSNPNGVSYGPLIGNPALKDFVGMRVDGKGTRFWFPQEAPEWLTFPLRQAAALTAQAEKKAAEEAAKAEAAAAAKQAADAAAEQARQDAATALAEKQAASEAKVAETKQQTEAQQAMLEQAKAEREQEAQAAQVLLEQAKAAQAQRSIEMEQYRQAGDILLERARRQQQSQPRQAPQGYEQTEEYYPEGGELDEGMMEGDYSEGGEYPTEEDGDEYAYEGEE